MRVAPLLCFLFACSGPVGLLRDGGAEPDDSGSSGEDSGAGGDAGVEHDAGFTPDGGHGTDGGHRDGGSATDAGASKVPMGSQSSAETEFVAAVGVKNAETRVYLKGGLGIPTSTAAAGLDTYYRAGQAVVYSMKVDQSPDSEALNKANLSALAQDIVRQGYASKTWICLHHEPYPELSGTAYQAMYATYAPSIRNAGLRCGVIYQSYPLYHGNPNYAPNYTDGILPMVDFIGIDIYPGTQGYGVGILQTISPFTNYAKQNGKPFQINEVAIDSAVSGTLQQQADWLAGLAGLHGSEVEVISYFEGTATTFTNLRIENNPQAVTVWRQLLQTFSK